MLHAARWMLAVGTITLVVPCFAVQAGGGDELVPNPFYKYWANFQPGSTVTRLEKTAFAGPEKNAVPDGIDEKVVTYKLLDVGRGSVTVEVTVAERGFLSTTESAPTKQTFPFMVKKSHLRAGLHEVDVKTGKDNIDVLGKKMECVTFSGLEKKGNTEVDHKIWVSELVPGGIVKQTRSTKLDGKAYADTTITVTAFKVVK
jgi:hypothetical protein